MTLDEIVKEIAEKDRMGKTSTPLNATMEHRSYNKLRISWDSEYGRQYADFKSESIYLGEKYQVKD